MFSQICRNFKIAVLLFLLSFPSYAYEEPHSTITISATKIVYIVGWIGPPIRDYILSLDPTKIKRIHLYSKGGKIRQALAIAEFVRKNGIETYVGEQGRCYSACTIIFQAGIKRIAHKSAKFMYHYAYNRIGPKNEIMVVDEYWTNVMCNTLVEYGMLKDLVDRMKPNQDIYFTAEEAMRYAIVTTIED